MLDQFSDIERMVIKIAVTELIDKTIQMNWKAVPSLTKEERDKTEEIISIARTVLDKIE